MGLRREHVFVLLCDTDARERLCSVSQSQKAPASPIGVVCQRALLLRALWFL